MQKIVPRNDFSDQALLYNTLTQQDFDISPYRDKTVHFMPNWAQPVQNSPTIRHVVQCA